MNIHVPSRAESTGLRRELSLPPGNLFRRLLTSSVIADFLGKSRADVVAERWPNDRILGQIVTRSASAPAMMAVTGWSTELMRLSVMDGIAAMGPAVAATRLLEKVVLLNFEDGGIISAPGFVASAANASFVADGDPIPVRQLTVSPATMIPHKVASIAVLSEEMLMSSNAEMLIGDTLIRSAGAALDAALFDSNAATPARPAGLRYNIAQTPPSSIISAWDAFFNDASNLVNAISAVAGGGSYYLITGPGRAVNMRLRALGDVGDPFYILGSNALIGDIVAVAPDAVVAAIAPEPEIELATATALHMDSAPGPIVDGGSFPGHVQGVFQTASVALKMRWRVSWALRDPRGVAWTTPSQW